MITCPWCDEDATGLVEGIEVDTYRCPACGTSVDLVCVDLVDAPAALDLAA
jgi:hypothetical protein